MLSSPTSTCSPSGHNTAPNTRLNTPGDQGRQSLNGNPDIRPLFDQSISLRCCSPLSGIPGHKGTKSNQHCDHMQQFNLHLLQKNPGPSSCVVRAVNEIFGFIGNVPARLKDRQQNEWIRTGKTMTQMSNRQCLANCDKKKIEKSKELIKNISDSQNSAKNLATLS